MTTPGSSDFVAALIGRLDWLSGIGANAVRAVAVVDVVAVAAFWVIVGRTWGVAGAVLAFIAVLPAAYLWWYASALDAAVRRTRIELGVRELLTQTQRSLGEVMEARRLRFGLIRAGWQAIRSVRELRAEVERLGFDLAAWATVANPGTLAAAGISVAVCAGVTVLSALAIVLAIIL
ncbi:MAG: hypothetical protein QNJ88_03610 [Acidimicrobiia bacterium]|nr:hypothetical protein [Acidimicrobiia bacterium]